MKPLTRLGIAALAVTYLWTASNQTSAAPNNIILFIGDGMGQAHVKAGRAFASGDTAVPLAFEQLGYSAQAVTTLPGGGITDSATAGTALATGYQHPVSGTISMDANRRVKTTILELARAKGYRTGIITTDEIGGATPGAFGAHEPDRSLTADIRYDYFFGDTTYQHDPSKPNVLLGGGYDDPTIVPGTSVTLVGGAQTVGYVFVRTSSDLMGVSNFDVVGLFGNAWSPMTGMAYRPPGTTEPTLSQMVSKALSILQGNTGVFLMVEGANIDKLSHSNNKDFVAEVAELDQAVQFALTWSNHSALPTLILVTADHETGGLSVPDQTIAAGTIPVMSFSSTGHTAANVPVFSTWPGTLNGLTMDNTEVFFLLEDYLNLPAGQPPTLSGLIISGVTETAAKVQWSTVEPSDSRVKIAGQTFSDSARVSAHSVVCSGLSPGTTYTLAALSSDLSGFEGLATAAFTTKMPNFNAIVVGEPTVTHGSVSGSYLGVLTAGDGSRQTITETPDGTGSSLLAEYQLRTSAPVDQIGTVTLQGVINWSQSDGASDNSVTEAWSLFKGWVQVQLPFTFYAPGDWIDSSGILRVRFHDSNSARREKKDSLGIDYLVGVIGKKSLSAPVFNGTLQAAAVSSTSIRLDWINADDEDGYQLFRNGQLIGSLPADTASYSDSGLSPYQTYSYQIQACNSVSCSDPLSASATTWLASPANLMAASAKGAVNLSWTNPNPSGASHQIFRDENAGGESTNPFAIVGEGVTTYSDSSAPRGVTLYYRVRTVIDSTFGPDSMTVSGKAR